VCSWCLADINPPTLHQLLLTTLGSRCEQHGLHPEHTSVPQRAVRMEHAQQQALVTPQGCIFSCGASWHGKCPAARASASSRGSRQTGCCGCSPKRAATKATNCAQRWPFSTECVGCLQVLSCMKIGPALVLLCTSLQGKRGSMSDTCAWLACLAVTAPALCWHVLQ
jgi:hypothetical protein